MSVIHFTHHHSMGEAMVGFSELCRQSGLSIGLSHTQEAIEASKMGIIKEENAFRYSLKSLFCTCVEDHPVFDKCFDVYWKKRKHNYAHKTNVNTTSNLHKNSKSSLVMAGFNPNGYQEEAKDQEEAGSVTGASKIESLKHTDFSKVATMDSEYLDQLTKRLLRQLNHRLKRKLQTSKKGKIDLRKTIRNNLSYGDDLIELTRKTRKTDKNKLILILDVSGSMDKYSFYLLRFIWSLKSHLKNIEAFIFSTELVRITDMLHHDQLTESMIQMSQHAKNWSGGTKIGECLKAFNEHHSKRVMNGRNITIILSDGLDDGNHELLGQEVQKIKLRTNKLVWLNPLKGMEGYEPLAKGMAVALPAIDDFRSAHNLSSLIELENILANA